MIFKNLLLIYHLPWGDRSTEIIKRWFRNNSVANKHLIVDYELEIRFPTLEQIHIEYPNVNTSTVVINPYARCLLMYEWAKVNKNLLSTSINFDNFENFLENLYKIKKIPNSLLGKSQTEIISYTRNNKVVNTTFVLRRENLIEDFKNIQKFVKSNVTLNIRNTEFPYSYKEKFNSKTAQIVNELYKDDLTNFNYSF